MPKKRLADLVTARYYKWRIYRRGKKYFADGRSNNPPLGRFSLGSDIKKDALDALVELDMLSAVQNGKAAPQQASTPVKSLPLSEGIDRYKKFVARPKVVGGTKPSTVKRYKSVFDKFLRFAKRQGIKSWNDVDRGVLDSYAEYLDKKRLAYSSQYLELTTVKTAMKWFVNEGLLPESGRIRLPLAKPDEETTTYCWTKEEVVEMLRICRGHPKLTWLSWVIVGLASTGLRISELANLRWPDIDFAQNMIRITNETKFAHKRRNKRTKVRETKSGRSRVFPIFKDFRAVLEQMPHHPDGRIFHGPRGGVLKPDSVRNILIRELLRPLTQKFPTPLGAEVGFVDGRLHSFRHFFCSECACSGVSERVVMKWLGHKSSAMVHRYFHLHDRESQQQMQRLDFFGEHGATSATGQSESEPGGSRP